MAIGVMPDGVGNAAHADSAGAFGLKDGESGLGDAVGGGGIGHLLYSVYYAAIRCIVPLILK